MNESVSGVYSKHNIPPSFQQQSFVLIQLRLGAWIKYVLLDDYYPRVMNWERSVLTVLGWRRNCVDKDGVFEPVCIDQTHEDVDDISSWHYWPGIIAVIRRYVVGGVRREPPVISDWHRVTVIRYYALRFGLQCHAPASGKVGTSWIGGNSPHGANLSPLVWLPAPTAHSDKIKYCF